jgi:hypothetical protein
MQNYGPVAGWLPECQIGRMQRRWHAELRRVVAGWFARWEEERRGRGGREGEMDGVEWIRGVEKMRCVGGLPSDAACAGRERGR